jgi:hypothetical protein
MSKPSAPNPAQTGQGQGGDSAPEQAPAEQPTPEPPGHGKDEKKRWPPDSLPNPLPGLDPQQTPGIDRLGGRPGAPLAARHAACG